MIPAWTEQYLAIPFLEKGRTAHGVDCYGLARLIYQQERGIELPSYTEAYATVQDSKEIRALLRNELASHWHEIDIHDAKEFDGVIFRIMGQPTHFGLVLTAPWFIHALKDRSATTGKVRIERWDSMWWTNRLLGAVRWQA